MNAKKFRVTKPGMTFGGRVHRVDDLVEISEETPGTPATRKFYRRVLENGHPWLEEVPMEQTSEASNQGPPGVPVGNRQSSEDITGWTEPPVQDPATPATSKAEGADLAAKEKAEAEAKAKAEAEKAEADEKAKAEADKAAAEAAESEKAARGRARAKSDDTTEA